MTHNQNNILLNIQKNLAKHEEQVKNNIREEIKVGDIYKIIEAKEVMIDRSSGYISLLCVDERTCKTIWLPLPTIYGSKGNLKIATLINKDVPLIGCTFRVDAKETEEITLRGLDTEIRAKKNIYTFTLLAY